MVDKSEKSDKKEKHEKEAKSEAKKEHKKQEEPKKKAPEKPEVVEKENFKGIVRIAGRDIRGQVKLKRALTYVRGISFGLATPVSHVINGALHITPDTRIGELSESQIENIDKILFSLQEHPIPKYLFNRRADPFDAVDKHVIMTDLLFAVKQDVEREKKIYTWKGYRHAYGQKVRGQRTRNTGRTGMAVGVLRKAVIAAGAPAATAAGAKGAAAPAGGAAAPAAAPAGGKAAPAAPAGGKAAPAAKPAEKK